MFVEEETISEEEKHRKQELQRARQEFFAALQEEGRKPLSYHVNG